MLLKSSKDCLKIDHISQNCAHFSKMLLTQFKNCLHFQKIVYIPLKDCSKYATHITQIMLLLWLKIQQVL